MIAQLLKHRKNEMYRAAMVGLSSIFFANIPLLLFLVYMAHHGFFSYDFFSDGVFGLKVFFFLTSIFVVVTSLAIFAWIVPLIERWKTGIFSIWTFLGFAIFNVFVCFVVLLAMDDIDWLRVVFVTVIGFFITCHIAFLIYAEPADQWRSLVSVIFVVTMMSLRGGEQASSVLSSALKVYGVGGGVEVLLESTRSDVKPLTGKLILLSPDYIYIKRSGSDEVSTIHRSEFNIVTVVKNNKSSEAKETDSLPAKPEVVTPP